MDENHVETSESTNIGFSILKKHSLESGFVTYSSGKSIYCRRRSLAGGGGYFCKFRVGGRSVGDDPHEKVADARRLV